MYQLSPISLKPEIRATRDNHDDFQTQLVRLIESAGEETEVIDSQCAVAKPLLNALDRLMSYGLLSGDRCYWNYTKQFLPKTECELLSVEWDARSDRAMSIAWLKDALNRGSLHFQLLAINHNKPLLVRFYHKNACVRNARLLSTVTKKIEGIQHAQFAFNSPSVRLEQPVAAAVVIEPMVTPSHTSRRRRRRRETETIPEEDASLLTDSTTDLTDKAPHTTKDQEFILNELIRQRRNRMNGFVDGAPPEEVKPDKVEERREERLDDVMRKTMSQLKMDDMESRSFDSLLHMDEMRRREEEKQEEKLVEGECSLQQGEILQLNMDVLIDVDQGERFQKMYHVYENFAAGNPLTRQLLVTDRNLYLITQSLATNDYGSAARGEALEEGVHTMVNYHLHTVCPIPTIDYVGVGVNSQVIVLYAKEGEQFKVLDEDRNSGKIVAISTADERLGIAITDAIVKSAEKLDQPPPTVFTDSTPYSIILKRFLLNELAVPAVSIQQMCLVYWRESAAGPAADQVSHQGYLYHRNTTPGFWRKSTADWTQSFFLLKGRKLYVFTDSSCKIGERVISLTAGEVETQEVELRKEHPHAFEMSFVEGGECLQMACQSREELNKWLHLISIALTAQTEEEDAVACCVLTTETHLVVAQEGARCMTDGFIRPLMVFGLEQITECIHVHREPHHCVILRTGTELQWLFFRSKDSVDRLVASLNPYPIAFCDLAEHTDQKLVVVIENQLMKIPDLWRLGSFGGEDDTMTMQVVED